MTKIAQNITELIGATPLMRLNRFGENTPTASLFAKLECFNPMCSVKDRVGLELIRDAEQRGLLKEGGLIVEPTSGNTGIGLAMAASALGYKLTVTMPASMSVERRQLLTALGATIVLTPAAEGMTGAIAEAERITAANPDAYMPRQFDNPANPRVHKRETGPEIWNALTLSLQYDITRPRFFVAGVGTGGTITGVGEYLKSRDPDFSVVAVEPSGSPVLSGGEKGSHGLQGIGAGFVPSILNREIIDRIITVNEKQAYTAARNFAKTEGLLCGISGGAALHAATVLAEEYRDATIVVMLPDTGERYLSTTLFTQN